MTEGSFDRVIQKIVPGAKLLQARRPEGGVSARVTALDVEWPDGQAERMVVRQYGDADRQR